MIGQAEWEQYIDYLRTGAPTATRVGWWRENVTCRGDALHAVYCMVLYAAKIVELIVPGGKVTTPVPVNTGTSDPEAMVRRLLNARWAGDNDMLQALVNVVCDAGHGIHDVDGVRYANHVVAILDQTIVNGMRVLGWHKP